MGRGRDLGWGHITTPAIANLVKSNIQLSDHPLNKVLITRYLRIGVGVNDLS